MPRALPVPIRQEIVRRRQQGQELATIAAELQLSYHSVRQIWRLYRTQGADGLTPRYHACARTPPADDPSILHHACELKRLHPTWGAGLIRIELAKKFIDNSIPSISTLQYSFRAAGVNRPRRRRRHHHPVVAPASRVHEVWQVDAVEKAKLADGREASWLSVTDEFSGAILDPELSPQEPWQQTPAAEVQAMFRRVFLRWGLPERMRVDNGQPWGSAHDLPTALALWLIGLGIEMSWNPPHQPWCNPKAERGNGVTQQWAEPHACPDHSTLGRRLIWAAQTQRQEYPSIHGQTRLQADPQLLHSGRPYRAEDEPCLWDLSRVDAFLAQGVWYRRADRYGLISLYNRNKCLGKAYQGQEVAIRFEPATRYWVVSDMEGQVIAQFIATELSRERIMKLEVGHRRPSRRKAKDL